MTYVVYSIEFFGVEIQAFFCLNWFFPSLFPSAPSMGQFFLWMRLLCEVSIIDNLYCVFYIWNFVF